MTAHTTLIYVRTSSDSKLADFASKTEMTSPSSDPPLSVLSNNTNAAISTGAATVKPSSIEVPRKSNDRTISGVFQYTNGTHVETGLPEHRLEQIRAPKNNTAGSSNTTAGSSGNGTGSLTNGSLKGGSTAASGTNKPASDTKAASVRSIGSSVERGQGTSGTVTPRSRALGSVEGQNRLSNGETTTDATSNASLRSGEGIDRRSKPPLLRGLSEGSTKIMAQPESAEISPTMRQPGSSVHRFSSPPRMSHVQTTASDATPRPSFSPEAPRLTHRHTLQIPRAGGGRDFSFSTGDEVITASGRFSPTRDHEPPTPKHRRPSLGLVRRTTRSMASDAYLDEVPPDEDAARWTELIKQKRASRRKKKEEEDDERVIVGKKVEEGHVNWVTAYNMLTGIRFTVSRTNAKIDRELTDADFDARHKFSFDVTGNELTPSAKYDFKFKDYSPWVFRHLRSIFGLDPADYLISLTSKYILSELGSPGKSGSFFYFSRDYKYIIKTIHHAEHKLLRKILREYYNHVRDNPNTLISQFYGLHRVKIPYGRKIHFVVMNNLFPPHRDIHQTFDLKGSTVGRDFKEEDLENNPRATLKDLNWLRRDLHLEFQQQIKKLFLDQIQKDVALLQKLHIMDYSLLVGMHDLEKGNEENVRATTLQVFAPGGERDEEDGLKGLPLMRTPSRLESARKARALRQTLKKEKPTPMSLAAAKMPDEMTSTDERKSRIFYSDDGGIRATHEDGTGGDIIYYLGVIDCLTHYGLIKRIEHFWKGLSNSRTQISPIPPQNYGDRFVNFITGVTMTREEAERRKTLEGNEMRESLDAHNILHHHHIPSISRPSGDGFLRPKSANEEYAPPRSPSAVDKTMRKAQKQVERESMGKNTTPEAALPDRALKTVTVPASESEKGDATGRNSTTLPVVEEVGEGSSDISSRRSGQRRVEKSPERTARSQVDRPVLGVRQVSTSTIGQQSIQEENNTNEKLRVQTPASEYFTPTSPNFSRPIPHSPLGHPAHAQGQYQGREKAPKLDGEQFPRLAPIFSSPDTLDPEKSVVGDDGEIIDGIDKLPGLDHRNQQRNTVR